MSAIRVRALERMKQLVEKTEHDLLSQRWGLNSLSDCRLVGFDCSLDSFAGSLLIPMCVVVVAT
jgi:hypothetical protein